MIPHVLTTDFWSYFSVIVGITLHTSLNSVASGGYNWLAQTPGLIRNGACQSQLGHQRGF